MVDHASALKVPGLVEVLPNETIHLTQQKQLIQKLSHSERLDKPLDKN